MKQPKSICESGWKQPILEGRFSIDAFTMVIAGIFFVFIMQFFVDNPSNVNFFEFYKQNWMQATIGIVGIFLRFYFPYNSYKKQLKFILTDSNIYIISNGATYYVPWSEVVKITKSFTGSSYKVSLSFNSANKSEFSHIFANKTFEVTQDFTNRTINIQPDLLYAQVVSLQKNALENNQRDDKIHKINSPRLYKYIFNAIIKKCAIGFLIIIGICAVLLCWKMF